MYTGGIVKVKQDKLIPIDNTDYIPNNLFIRYEALADILVKHPSKNIVKNKPFLGSCFTAKIPTRI